MSHEEDPELFLKKLENLRRSIDLRLDREGRWFHDGEAFRHSNLVEAFNRGIKLHPESNEPILQVGRQWCYIRSDDTPFIALRARFEDHALTALLNTHESVRLPHDSLSFVGESFYSVLVDGRLVRLNRTATASIAEYLDEEEDTYFLCAPDGTRWPVKN